MPGKKTAAAEPEKSAAAELTAAENKTAAPAAEPAKEAPVKKTTAKKAPAKKPAKPQ